MVPKHDWQKYRERLVGWYKRTSDRLNEMQKSMENEQKKIHLVASFCLASCEEYLKSACDAFEKGYILAGKACLRPIAETALIFRWCGLRNADFQERAKRWRKSTRTEERKFLDALGETSVFKEDPGAFKDVIGAICCELNLLDCVKRLPSLRDMAKEIDEQLSSNDKAKDDYTMLFKYLCAGSHARLDPDRYLCLENDTVVRREAPLVTNIEPWVLITCVFRLVLAVYECLGWDPTEIRAEYAKELVSINPD